jgi:hypothetical protein
LKALAPRAMEEDVIDELMEGGVDELVEGAAEPI